MKKIFDSLIGALIAGVAVSFILSMFRLASNGRGVYCEPLMIDQMEPVVSTRWFCEAKKP